MAAPAHPSARTGTPSHRREDLRLRIDELARLPDESIPRELILSIVQPAQMRADMREWNEHIKAAPPQPRWQRQRLGSHPAQWLEPVPRHKTESPPRSIDDRRLDILKEWMRKRGILPDDRTPRNLSDARVSEHEDFEFIMETLRSGILAGGRRLARIDTAAAPLKKTETLATPGSSLTFNDLELSHLPPKPHKTDT